jgi:hypothetical protein
MRPSQRFLDTFPAACKARGWIKPCGTSMIKAMEALQALAAQRVVQQKQGKPDLAEEVSCRDAVYVDLRIVIHWRISHGADAPQHTAA